VKLACEYSDCRDQLIWAADVYIRPETLARITDAYQRAADRGHLGGRYHLIFRYAVLPLRQAWQCCGDVNARYARDPGFSFYTHLSDQQGVLYSIKVMSATEAPYVLDGLLQHAEHRDPLHGHGRCLGHVFILCTMLGIRFCPRLRNLPGERNHQGKSNVLLFPQTTEMRRGGPIECRERLGDLLHYYHRDAA
jgi:TnpA family transposase